VSEAGLTESLSTFIASANPTLATYAKPDGIHLRITAKSASQEDARRLVDEVEGKIVSILGSAVWGYDDDTPPEVLGQAARGKIIDSGNLRIFHRRSSSGDSGDGTRQPGLYKRWSRAVVSEARIAQGLDRALATGGTSVEEARELARLMRLELRCETGCQP